MFFGRKNIKDNTVDLGTGIHLDSPGTILPISYPDSYRKGHFWCFGTTRVGKTRCMENIIEQDIRKGYSVVVIDPKGDADLFSKIVQVAFETGRHDDLMLINPIFPEFSATLDPLSSYYMVEELVAHITAGVAVGREPYYYSVAYEVSLLVVQSLIMLARATGQNPSFNLSDIKNSIGHEDLAELKEKLDYIDDPEAEQLSRDLAKLLITPAEFNSKVGSSLRVALTELTSGNIGKIIGHAEEDRFIERLEAGKGVILVVQLGSLLTKRAAYSAGKVLISMIQAFVGRRYSSDKRVTPPLALHIDEAQSVLYHGIEDLFAKAGGAGIFIHGYCQSISQLYSEIGQDRANTILDNCNTKLFMRVPDTKTAKYVSTHLGEKRTYSPIISLGGGLSIRETEETRIKHTEVLNLAPRQFFLTTYSGVYRGVTKDVSDASIKVIFPDIKKVAQA
ncbi:type IV secretory system conjugative DNA transfer family protein [Desulfopila aestuarii]|uniref:Type IV secretion-system coupling protein DNA-binding domain-containing protein n=1 Tax=Desulfopila aestuarii DSM 18488 TaxID=1121416 RepID=A0A1M7YLH7_9BACT|nr:TraM recognition domain-containing protein [Desulfopila aestuarii]SHO53470.1 Type IV secretion-system coupling protein DNA-binding domain-containing protein [Desulfopila aestuarii DSM 18488]